MSRTVGDFVVQRLHDWDVSHIFGYPGDGINGVFGALNRADGKIQFIQARHEEMAAFMASAYAKFSGRLGVCISTACETACAARTWSSPRPLLFQRANEMKTLGRHAPREKFLSSRRRP